MAPVANTFVAGDERTCLALKTNTFGAGDEITRLRLETKECSAKDGTRLMLKETCLVLEVNASGTGGECVSQETMHTFVGLTVRRYTT